MNRIPGSRILEGVFAGGHLLLLLLGDGRAHRQAQYAARGGLAMRQRLGRGMGGAGRLTVQRQRVMHGAGDAGSLQPLAQALALRAGNGWPQAQRV